MRGVVDIEHGSRPRGYSETDHRVVRDACAKITSRTGYRAWYNFVRMTIGFGYRRPSDGEVVECWSVPMFRDGRNPTRFAFDEPIDVDQAVYVLQAGKRSLKDKMRLQRQHERRRREMAAERRRSAAAVAGDAAVENAQAFGRKSAVVDGRKGS